VRPSSLKQQSADFAHLLHCGRERVAVATPAGNVDDVMGLHKLTAGDGYTYLTRQVAAQDVTSRGYNSLGDYYAQKGESPGVWMGRGLNALPDFVHDGNVTEAQMVALFGEGRHPDAVRIEHQMLAAGHSDRAILSATRLGSPFRIYDAVPAYRAAVATRFGDFNAGLGLPRDWPIPADERARIRTEVAREMFAAQHGRPPVDARELSGFVARASRQATVAVAGYDLTFSPVKSVSVLWAVAPKEIAERIEAAHHAAVADTVAWLENHAAYTRTGRNGVAQVDVKGLLAAAFTHRDSRAGDPDLHTHVAVSNKVQTLAGQWLALDGRPLHKMTVAASERYNTRLEAHLVAAIGVRFAERAGADPAKRPVREIVGVDETLATAWSARRAAINVRRGELSARFQADHGRTPSVVEAMRLAQQATLETRHAKHEPRSHADQRATWRRQAVQILGGRDALAAMIRRATNPEPAPARVHITDEWVRESAAQIIVNVSSGRATWQETHLRAEAERLVRAAGISLATVDAAVDGVVAAALDPRLSITLGVPDPVREPAALRRLDGSSVYCAAGSQLYTSAQIIDAEHQLLTHAQHRDRRILDTAALELALLEETANGVQLNPGQVQLVRDLATSGARLQLALAPAGTGKTTAMKVLARAWADDGGNVIGLAPSAAAAAVLRDEIGVHTDTLAKLLWSIDVGPAPAWVHTIGPKTLVIIDEAGMAGTTQLAQAVDHITAAGGSVRLIGDDQQLAAIGAGGILRDIADTVGALTLSQVMRFADPAEGAASLALRAGDPAAIGFYLDNTRVHVGDSSTVADAAYQAWATDRDAGRDTVMLAPTRDLVTDLNTRAREDRLTRHRSKTGREVTLVDGTKASAGDTVITRTNDRRIPITQTDWVKNGDRWAVTKVGRDGALHVTHLTTKRNVTLPAGYSREHVALGYATTVHGAQGVTADTCHSVATGTETRQLLYVAMSRGKLANHLYLTTAGDGNPHAVITRDALLPPTAVDILTRIVGRDDSPTSATSTQRTLSDPATRLGPACDRYADALAAAATQLLGVGGLADIDMRAERELPGLTNQPAYPTLRAHLALLAVDGCDPTKLLHAAVGVMELDTATDPAAVLDWRLDSSGHHSTSPGPLPWLPAIPDALAANEQWSHYLRTRAHLITDLADQVAVDAHSWTPTSAPAWAASLVGRDDTLLGDLAIWRSAATVQDADRRFTGPTQLRAADIRAQRALDERATATLGDPKTATNQWATFVASIDARIPTDQYWPQLAYKLAAAGRAGIDVRTAVIAAGAKPLPDEYPAAALWWRLSRHLAPAALAATAASSRSALRPAWTTALHDVMGTDLARRVVGDPAWPGLVAAVTEATRAGWQPEQVLAAAYDLISAGQGGEPVHGNELATAITWRVHMLAAANDSHAATGSAAVDRTWPHDTDVPPPDDDSPTSKPGASPNRIAELNQRALGFFAAHYAGSWSARYLRDRLGNDLLNDRRFTPGYAPPGWTLLTEHLRGLGVSDNEILATGLGTYTRYGTVIDRFRDRLMLPIYDHDDIVGFIGRRNPEHDDAGPKYLNTPETSLFHKGNQLYGLAESAAALAGGATPVLVEGPIDAIAVTLAGDNKFAGVAPLGTAFTDSQADSLRPFIGVGKPGVTVATDADKAGRTAAVRAYWQLVVRGDNPRYVEMAAGLDPAELLATSGYAALRDVLQHATSLAQVLIDNSIAAYVHRLHTAEGTVLAVRAAAHVISALPPDEWMHHIGYLTDRLGPDTISLAHLEVLDAGHAWIGDKAGKTHLALLEPAAPPRPQRADATTQAPSHAATWAAPIQGVNTNSVDAGAPPVDAARERLAAESRLADNRRAATPVGRPARRR
jgi:DNA primase catalytic core